MTDTDLITAGESTDSEKLSDSAATETSEVKTNAPVGSLSTMVLPELRALANQAGVKGTSGMRKNELIAAIQETRGQANGRSAPEATGAAQADETAKSAPPTNVETPTTQGEQRDSAGEAQRRERRGSARDAGPTSGSGAEARTDGGRGRTDEGRGGTGGTEKRQGGQQDTKSDERASDAGGDQNGDQQGSGGQQRGGDDDGDGRQGRRGRRFRDRRRRGERSGEGAEAELREDDVVQPVAGILDVLDNYAFVRTSGYLAGPHDVYVSMNMVRKNGLRRGDAVTGAVRLPKDGEQPNQRQKFNPLVRLDSVNGGSAEDAKKRPDFSKLTPLYPNQRLRLETTPDRLTTRVIDLIMPIGKGQRALIVSPPKAGKTTILQDIANAITKNNPECHLMVVLVDERPEEVTDMTRSVKGEVIASTFDRPPTDHTAVAELAIERAKRLVEQGKDVVVLLDSITRLGRAYNNASPASGRILSGGVDSTALYPPKRFLGAARNIEGGGSLTIIATAMVETGSTGDTVIFEEFKGTGNAELKLDRKISERRVFPAVDVNPSGTRKDELLLSPDEFGIVHKLRRVLSGLDSHQAIDLLMSQLRKTKNNYEFLVQVSKTTPANMDND
ncbi:MAG: transcription termination factor Rho [Mycobacterium sp.]|uniref:transcription termination factor Rho n=1 Tax=Mycobacterium sp. TaxID=1785 RepID=UPI001EBC43C7|nr:transcription termination factor Rho [Mycobacterium sp.]MBW0016079.1 transcription termination factor Rho [Mycobacterium sp.]